MAAEIGVGRLSMGLVAERVGVTTLALDKPVDSLADLTHRIAVLAMDLPLASRLRARCSPKES
ncbi:hypothetical protein [Ferrimicrobium sp.]|uniref:hypothetical protein n=1 Tax=Ferrimicrobium sp. TaxID=2926050 RepID=UPI00262E5C06|nr:hypothetical protein [Ferrimicrobium sp.]